MPNFADALFILGRVGVVSAIAASDAFTVAAAVYPNHLISFARVAFAT